MDLTQKIDIPLMLDRLAPNSEYHWKGDGFGTYADIGEWRSPHISKPSEIEIYTEWERYQVQALAQQHELNALYMRVVGTNVYEMDSETLRACVVLLMLKANAITLERKIKPIVEWF